MKVIAVCVEPVSPEVPCGDHLKCLEIHLKSIGQEKLDLLIDNLLPDRSFFFKIKNMAAPGNIFQIVEKKTDN